MKTSDSQLHLLLQSFPPPRDHAVAYRGLIVSALKAGLLPLGCENAMGRTALHVFCLRLGAVTVESYPDAGNVLHLILHSCFDQCCEDSSVRSLRPDKTGTAVLSLEESVAGSWLGASRGLLSEAIARIKGGNIRRALLDVTPSVKRADRFAPEFEKGKNVPSRRYKDTGRIIENSKNSVPPSYFKDEASYFRGMSESEFSASYHKKSSFV
jgi:hypothetical protein